MSTWLVTGGAGYIGSHVTRELRAAGFDVVVLDDLSSGHPDFVPPGVPLVRANVTATDTVARTLHEHAVAGVVHLAAFKYAGESVARPLHTYEQNVVGTLSLLRAMREEGVGRIVFSSSAAVYGTPDSGVVTEETPTAPESPYGESKLIGEWLLADEARATAAGPTPLRCTALRYFNVVGSGDAALYDSSPHNLFPLVFDALLAGRTPVIRGDDYATPDGTCVRDYVHVTDVARAHVAAARALEADATLAPVYNLGSGLGLSVREVMTAIGEGVGAPFTPLVAERRPGDPAQIVASGELATRDLDWHPAHPLAEMVASAWRARTAASAASAATSASPATPDTQLSPQA